MLDVVYIVVIIGLAYFLFDWLPSYFRKRRERSQRQVLDLKFNEDPRNPPESDSREPAETFPRATLLRGMLIVAAVLVIGALAFRSFDLVYVLVIWAIPMLLINYLPRIIRWFRNQGD